LTLIFYKTGNNSLYAKRLIKNTVARLGVLTG
jgi:hypothetical protein